MSRKTNGPEWREPVEAIVVEVVDPIEDSIEVGEIILADGPIDSVPLGEGRGGAENYQVPRSSAGPMPDFGGADKQDGGKGVTEKVQDAAQGIAGKAQDAVQAAAGKAQDVAQGVTGKAQDVAQSVAGKVQDITHNVADSASSAKSAVSGVVDTAKSATTTAGSATKSALSGAAGKIGSASATGVRSVGAGLWSIVQRNPLQSLALLFSALWLFRNNKDAASRPVVSLPDAAEDAADKVGTVAGHVQVAASNLSAQVSEHAQRSAGWFGTTLQETPLAIGAMATVVGAAIGFAIPESSYEHKMLGQKRDELVAQAQDAASDLTQKVTTVAQSAAHEAIETAKTEAKNQGFTPPAPQ